MTAEDKIAEAKYNFDKLPTVIHNEKEFQFELSNFLGSCYSVLQHLLEDHKNKFGLNVDYVTIKTFRDEANKTHNKNAVKFIQWFSEEQQKLRVNKSYGFLLARRNHSVHTKTVKPEQGVSLDVGITPVWMDIKTGEKTDGERKTGKVTFRFFNENSDDNALTVCDNFLTHIKGIVENAKKSA